jgi:hypothetical protein
MYIYNVKLCHAVSSQHAFLTVTYLSLLAVWFEPTDVRKAGKAFQSRHWTTLGYVSPNLNELLVMSQASGEALHCR